jgi:menaquinone-dependent protoporphyrinogen oxidase
MHCDGVARALGPWAPLDAAMTAILIVYSSTDGHTKTICERLRQLNGAAGNRVTLVSIEDADAMDLAAFDKIVIGASIRYGRHKRQVLDFVNANVHVLDAKPNAFFSVNIVARKPQKNRPETNPYVRKFLEQIRWRPKNLEVFAGRLDYPRYGFFDRLMIRFIMWITQGPTDPTTVVEFTDWQRVEAFARRVGTM